MTTSNQVPADRAHPQSKFKYRGFISYSHQNAKWASWLHRSLETYRVPRSLRGEIDRFGAMISNRIYPVFRDREELPANSDLGQMITSSLLASRTLLVICSPEAAASHWVNEEILEFKRQGKGNHILALIVDGEPNGSNNGKTDRECFPPALRFNLGKDKQIDLNSPAEPIAADVRGAGDGKQDALTKIIAGVLGIDYDILKQRERIRRRKKRRQIALLGTITMAVIVGSVIYPVSMILTRNQYDSQLDRFFDDVEFTLRTLSLSSAETLKSSSTVQYKRDSLNSLIEGMYYINDEIDFITITSGPYNSQEANEYADNSVGANQDGREFIWATNDPLLVPDLGIRRQYLDGRGISVGTDTLSNGAWLRQPNTQENIPIYYQRYSEPDTIDVSLKNHIVKDALTPLVVGTEDWIGEIAMINDLPDEDWYRESQIELLRAIEERCNLPNDSKEFRDLSNQIGSRMSGLAADIRYLIPIVPVPDFKYSRRNLYEEGYYLFCYPIYWYSDDFSVEHHGTVRIGVTAYDLINEVSSSGRRQVYQLAIVTLLGLGLGALCVPLLGVVFSRG